MDMKNLLNGILLLLLLVSMNVACTHHQAVPEVNQNVTKDVAQNVVQEVAVSSVIYRPQELTKSDRLRMIPLFELTSHSCTECGNVIFTSFERKHPKKKFLTFDDAYGFIPSIVIKRKDKMESIRFSEYVNYGWIYAAKVESKGYYWGFLDYQVEDHSSEVIVIASFDAGKTWTTHSIIKKKHYQDYFRTFIINDDGRGFALVERDDSEGFTYRYNTLDFGKTWSAPEEFHFQPGRNYIWDDQCAFRMYAPDVLPKNCSLIEK